MSEPAAPLNLSASARPLLATGDTTSVSIVESDAFYEIRAELRGVAPEDIIVGVVDGTLTIGATATAEIHRPLGRFFCVDHRVIKVEQSFALPADANAENLTTRFNEGVFSVFLNREAASNVIQLQTRS